MQITAESIIKSSEALCDDVVNDVLLGSFAPISLFFLLSGSSYEFLMLLHVTIFAICGVAGLTYIYKNFHYIRQRSVVR